MKFFNNFLFQCTIKIFVGYCYNYGIVSLFDFSVQVYSSSITPNRVKILESQLEKNKRVLLRLMYVYMGGLSVFSPSVIYTIFYMKEVPFPLYIPYVDHTTSVGYIVTLANLFPLIYLVFVGNLAYIAMYALIVLLYGDTTELIEESFKQLSMSRGPERSYLFANTVAQIKDGLR